MIPCHLSGYHLLWFNFEAVLSLENPEIRQPCVGLLSRTPNRAKPKFEDKTPVQRYRNIIHNFVHSCWRLDVSYVHLRAAVRDRAFTRSLCCCCSKP